MVRIDIGEIDKHTLRRCIGFAGTQHSPFPAALSHHDALAIERHLRMHTGRRRVAHFLGEAEGAGEPFQRRGVRTVEDVGDDLGADRRLPSVHRWFLLTSTTGPMLCSGSGRHKVCATGLTWRPAGAFIAGLLFGTGPMERWLQPALDYICSWIEFQMRLSEQPGCILAVAHRDRITLERAFGHADLMTGEKLTPRHRFRIASHSKSFTAAGVMKLREQRRLRLDDPVGQHVKQLHPRVAEVRSDRCCRTARALAATAPMPGSSAAVARFWIGRD